MIHGMRLSLLCPICPVRKGNWSCQSKASILSTLFAPAYFENIKTKSQIWRIWDFMGYLPLYLLLAEDSNFRPTDYKSLGIVFVVVCQKATDL